MNHEFGQVFFDIFCDQTMLAFPLGGPLRKSSGTADFSAREGVGPSTQNKTTKEREDDIKIND